MHSPTLCWVPQVGPNIHILGLAVTPSVSNLSLLNGSVILPWHQLCVIRYPLGG
jgi:hypothetical protein